MAYDKDKYDKLRSLRVPRELALALADDESPINAGSSDGPQFPFDIGLPSGRSSSFSEDDTPAETVELLNLVVSALKYGGVLRFHTSEE